MNEIIESTDFDEFDEYDEMEEDSQPTTEWLSFSLDDSRYAVDILRVTEIRTWEQMTRIPYAKSFLLGLINLRGAIVPIVDLRKRFGLEERTIDKETVVLIMTVETTQGQKTRGIMVDKIRDVLNLKDEEINKGEKFDLTISEKFVNGITDINGSMAVLLDIDTVLDTADFES